MVPQCQQTQGYLAANFRVIKTWGHECAHIHTHTHTHTHTNYKISIFYLLILNKILKFIHKARIILSTLTQSKGISMNLIGGH